MLLHPIARRLGDQGRNLNFLCHRNVH
jgi:hypothetical protein